MQSRTHSFVRSLLRTCLVVSAMVLVLALTSSTSTAGLKDGVGGLRVTIHGEGGGSVGTAGEITGAAGGEGGLGREELKVADAHATSPDLQWRSLASILFDLLRMTIWFR